MLRLPPPEQMINLTETVRSAWNIGTLTSIFGSFILVGWNVITHKKSSATKEKTFHESSLAYILMLIWFAVPVILFGFYKKGIYDYYFGILFVLPFLFITILIQKLWSSLIGKLISIALVSFLLFLNWEGRPFKFPPNNQLLQAKTIAAAALEKTDGKPFNFALLANFNSDHAYRYFFEAWGRAPVPIENYDVDPMRKSVTDQLIIICELPECKPLGHPLWEIAGFGRAEITGEWNVSFVKVMRLVHYKEESQ